MSDRLKLCPFCGKEPIVVRTESTFSDTGEIFSIDCDSKIFPHAHAIASTEDAVVEAWNTRAPDPRDVLLERCKLWLEEYKTLTHFRRCNDPECLVCAQNNIKFTNLTILLSDISAWERYKDQK